MFKLFKRKTEEEKQLEFVERYKAPSYNLDKLCGVIASIPRPFEISEWIEHEICLTGYKQIRGNIYQEAYLAVSEDNVLFITTNPKGAQAYVPFAIIYSVEFPRENRLRRRMTRLAKTYMRDLRCTLREQVNVEVDLQTNYFRELFLVFE